MTPLHEKSQTLRTISVDIDGKLRVVANAPTVVLYLLEMLNLGLALAHLLVVL